MKKQSIFLSLVILLTAVLILSGCGNASATDSPTPTGPASGTVNTLIVQGRIVPRDFTTLYAAGGKVEEVIATEGARVSKGTVLLRLGDREAYQANAAGAQAEVAAAGQALDQLNRTATLSYHQAILDEAAAQKTYNAARKAWDVFDQDQYEKDLDQAKSEVVSAKTGLKDAQDEYAKYADRNKDNADRIRTKDALDAAQTKYDNALIKQSEIENRFNQVNSSLAVAQGRLDEASRSRQQRVNGPDKDQLALAQANLSAAQAHLAAAQTALDRLDVVAPYDGVVARVDISAGENALPGQPVIVFADVSQWYVETTDLTETEVVAVRAGQTVTVVPDALPTLTLSGTVDRVGLTYIEKAGDIVYPVRIQLDPSDANLFWGMTVEVRIKK